LDKPKFNLNNSAKAAYKELKKSWFVYFCLLNCPHYNFMLK
jgi:hypothetical protein